MGVAELLKSIIREDQDINSSNDGKSADTYVHLRTRGIPAQKGSARVCYDAWGQPYVNWVHASTVELFDGGKTNYTQLYGTEWLHKSGPKVSFGRVPSDMFEDVRERNQ